MFLGAGLFVMFERLKRTSEIRKYTRASRAASGPVVGGGGNIYGLGPEMHSGVGHQI